MSQGSGTAAAAAGRITCVHWWVYRFGLKGYRKQDDKAVVSMVVAVVRQGTAAVRPKQNSIYLVTLVKGSGIKWLQG